MIRMVISRLLKNAFLRGYEAGSGRRADQCQDAIAEWAKFDPEPTDWKRLDEHLSAHD